MKVIKPTTMTPSMLISSSATESYSNWSSSTTYPKDAIIVYDNYLYRSLQASNLNRIPSEVGSLWWVVIAPSNRWAMFDGQISTVTKGGASASLSVEIATGFIDSLFIGNVKCTTLTVTIRDGLSGPIGYQQTFGMTGDAVSDWYQYFFYDPFTQRTQVYLRNLPLFSDAHVTLTFNGAVNTIEVGTVAFGRLNDIGLTQYGANAGIIDYSRKETDEFGETTFVKRKYSKRLSASVKVDMLQLNRVQRFLSDIRATPCIWIGSDDPYLEETMVVFGFYRDFSTEIIGPTVANINIEIEGLI